MQLATPVWKSWEKQRWWNDRLSDCRCSSIISNLVWPQLANVLMGKDGNKIRHTQSNTQQNWKQVTLVQCVLIPDPQSNSSQNKLSSCGFLTERLIIKLNYWRVLGNRQVYFGITLRVIMLNEWLFLDVELCDETLKCWADPYAILLRG